MLTIRKADIKDLKDVLSIYDDARQKFANDKTFQWKDNYPNETTYKRDLEENNVFVILCNENIAGVMTILLKEEPDYKVIEGKWINNEPYITIHRIAVKKDYLHQGLGSKLISFAKQFALENGINNIKIDTHENNIHMKKMLGKHDFKYCGVIYLHEKNMETRDAFQLEM